MVMVMNPYPYKWFWSGYGLVFKNIRPCTPLREFNRVFQNNIGLGLGVIHWSLERPDTNIIMNFLKKIVIKTLTIII
jgi:hypothetical protein